VQRLERLPTPEREPVPSNTSAELRRERARLRLLANQIREIETARLQRQEQRLNCGVHPMVRLLAGFGVLASGLQTAHEAFSRGLRDRRASARDGGLTGSPKDRLLMINTEPCS
jgi:transposase